jgi:predicted MarR family transcription regulator
MARPRRIADKAKGLGRAQKLVLHTLASAERPKSVKDLQMDWYSILSEASVASAVVSLGDRSLIDAAGFDGRARTYAITQAGIEVDAMLVHEEPEDDEDE